ncbi:MAG: hypothetical protein FJ217_15515, partial [Ignavibacteria bacterium]|nr:hypothetical protein [Ignavibacteria bacterium]
MASSQLTHHRGHRAMRKIPYSLALLFAFLLSIPAFTQEYRPDANTVLLLHMNETSGSTVSDAGPRGWNGSFGAGSFVSGKFGNAFQPGSREGISVPDFSSAGLDERFTAEIWIKLDGAPTSDLSLYSNNSFRRRIQADLSVVFGITHTDSSVVAIHSPPSILTAGKWFHLVGLLENRVTKLYIDGALIGTAAHGLPMITGAAGTTIGQSGMALPLEGLIDEIRVSNKARTPEEFNLQLPPKNLAGTPSRTSVALSWEKGGGMVGCLWYKIYRGEDSTSVGLIDSTTQLSYINTGLSPGKFYFYRVSAVDSTGFESAKSYAVRCYLPIVGEYQADANTVLLLHMNETSDSTAYDASSYGNHGAANNTTTEQGRFGKARRFAAASSNVHVRHSSSLDFGTGSYTLESWVKHFGPVGEGGHLLFKVTVPLGWDLYLRPDGHLQFDEQYDDGRTTSVASSRPMADGRWHHCAAVSTATRQFLYVDGVLDSSTNVTNRGRFDHTADLVIGKSQGTSPFNGLIDEVRISNRARSPEEFNLQLPPKNLSATASRTSVSLIWQNGGGAVPLMRYRIYRGADSTSLSLIDSTTQLLYSNTGLSSGTRFYYRVSAVDSTGFESVKSYALSAVTAPLLGEYAPDTSTVLLLHMNETTGSTVSDASSYGNHGTATGTTIIDGKFGKARSFNGSSDYIALPAGIFNSGNQNTRFTLEAWIQPTATIDSSTAGSAILSSRDRVDGSTQVDVRFDGGTGNLGFT